MDKILILDFGSQYTQLIARRVRELNVYCDIFPFDISPSKIQDFKKLQFDPKIQILKKSKFVTLILKSKF